LFAKAQPQRQQKKQFEGARNEGDAIEGSGGVESAVTLLGIVSVAALDAIAEAPNRAAIRRGAAAQRGVFVADNSAPV
jgi:hypothetical protein